MTNEYNVNSIKALSDREHVRLRPSMYIGNSNIAGLNQLIYEICDNSVDEFLAGYGNVIDVHIYKNCSVRIKDFGRGVPCALTKDAQGNDINSLTLAFSRLMAGGKYNQQSYSISSGTFGIGSSVVNFCSSFFHVTVCRDGKIFQQKFEKGVPVTDVEIIGTSKLDEFGKEVTGTEIYYQPDPEIFTQTLQPGNEVRTRLMELAVLNSGLTINYINDLTKTNETFQYNNGIINYLKEVVNNKKLLFEQPFYIKDTSTIDNKNVQCELAFIYDDEVESSSSIRSFVNNINTYMGGTHLNGFREAIKTVLNEFGIKNKLIKEPLELKYYLDGFYGVISLKMSNPSFEGQTKIKLNNPEVENIVVSIVKKYFNTVKDENIKNILTTIVLRSVHVKEAEIAARKARIEKRAAIKVTKQALPIQLADCVNAGTGKYAELFIAEGNSAHGAIKQARDPITMAALPLRGKILNTEKASFDQFIKSPAIQNIITALGTGFGKHFDINKLRYDKIIMACFKGDTKVKMLDGTIKTFEELVELEKRNPDQTYWVYSCKPDGTIVPGKMQHPRITQYTQDIMQIYTDDGGMLETTLDHRFMLRDGTYCEAQNLKVGDSLMPLYIRTNSSWSAGREELYNNSSTSWQRTHRVVMEYFDDGSHSGRNWHVHHINRNFLDNRPENMKWQTMTEHMKEHSDHIIAYNQSQEHRDRVKQLHQDGVYQHTYWGNNGYNGSEAQKTMLQELNQREDIKQIHSQVITEYNHSEQNREATRRINQREDVKLLQKQGRIIHAVACLIRKGQTNLTLDMFNRNNDTFKKLIINIPTQDKILAVFSSFDEMLQKAIDYEKNELTDEMFKQLTNVEEMNKIRVAANLNTKRNSMAKLGKKIFDQGLPFNEQSYQTVKQQTNSKAPRWENITEYFSSIEEFEEYSKNYNHKVTAIECVHYADPIPMYCGTVEEYHNFAVVTSIDANTVSGVFVRNCDADVDGYHIRALIITFIYNYMRDLITQGHLYAAIPPLFKVIYKNKPIYLQDDIALNKWKTQHKNDTYEVQRFKG